MKDEQGTGRIEYQKPSSCFHPFTIPLALNCIDNALNTKTSRIPIIITK